MDPKELSAIYQSLLERPKEILEDIELISFENCQNILRKRVGSTEFNERNRSGDYPLRESIQEKPNQPVKCSYQRRCRSIDNQLFVLQKHPDIRGSTIFNF